MIVVLETDVCREGFLYDKLENTDVEVFTDASWDDTTQLMNDKGTAMLKPSPDANGDFILGGGIAVNPDWGGNPSAAYNAFISGATTKNFVYWELKTDINGNPIPC